MVGAVCRRHMRALVLCAAIALCASACDSSLGPPRRRPLPALDNVPALLTPGPPRSPRLASYKIDARYDAAAHRVEATSVLTWTNGGKSEVDALPFHLYLNGFKNDRTTLLRSRSVAGRGSAPVEDFGHIKVARFHAREWDADLWTGAERTTDRKSVV